MKLHPLNLVRLAYLDSGQFIVRYLTDFENSGLDPATDPDFKIIHDALIAQSPLFNAALMQVRAKAESEELQALDLRRDRKMATLRRAHSVFEYTDIAAELAAYKLIKIILRTYKNIERANFEAESLGLDNLAVALQNADNLPSMKVLKLEGHLNNIKLANDQFKAKFSTRSSDTISTVVYDTKVLRTDIFTTYKNLAEYVLVMAKNRSTNPFYADLLTIVNNGRSYFATILARQASDSDETPATPSV
jgi:Family of unknown function (DUF6261)